jgi:FAD/FMN-containing dehydrogenase
MMPMPTLLTPTSIADVQAAVRDSAHVLPRGNGTKTALSATPDGVAPLDLSNLSGVIGYRDFGSAG